MEREMTMVERVAKAICDSLESDDFDSLGDRSIVKHAYLQQARAAIDVICEKIATVALDRGDEELGVIIIAALKEHDGA